MSLKPIVREVVGSVVKSAGSAVKAPFNWSAWWATLISAVVEDAQPTHIVLTFPTAKTVNVADFSISGVTAGITVDSLSWVGTVLTLTLSGNVVYGDNPIIAFKVTNTHAVTNNTLWSTYWLTQKAIEQAAFLTEEFGTLVCFNLASFSDTSVPTSYDPDLFAPTENIEDSINDWLDDVVAAGMGYAILTVKSHEGFCLWPTTSHATGNNPYSIAESSWYVPAGSPDIVKIFTDECRARGLKVGLYWSLYDLTYEAREGVDCRAMNAAESAAYITFNKLQLYELCTNYGTIDMFWLDGWGWRMPYTVDAGIPYNTLREYIGSYQRDCIIINNNPGIWPANSDIRTFEGWANAPGAGNTDPAEHVVPSMVNGLWFFTTNMENTEGDDARNASHFYTPAQVETRRALVNGRNSNMLIASSPNSTGQLNVYERITLLGSNPDLLIYPILATVETDTPTIVTITFIKALDGTSVPATTDFALAGKTISNVAIVGNTVQLTVTVAYAIGDSITVNYTKPVANMLKDAVGNQVASFMALSVTNNIIATDIEFLLTKTGTGLGVATLVMASSEDVLLTLGANAKFYSDAGGTLDESATWTVTAGANRTRYIRCSTGTATFTVGKNKIIRWGASTANGWVSTTNAPSVSGDISRLTALQQIRITGLNTLSGSMIVMSNLTYLRLTDNSTPSGNISGFTNLTYLALSNYNTIAVDVGLIADGLQQCTCGVNASKITTYTSGANWSELINGSTIQIMPPAPYGLDSTEVDNLIIDVAATMTPGRAINIVLQGNCEPRTSASDAARAAIIAAGGTVTTN